MAIPRTDKDQMSFPGMNINMQTTHRIIYPKVMIRVKLETLFIGLTKKSSELSLVEVVRVPNTQAYVSLIKLGPNTKEHAIRNINVFFDFL